MMSDAFPISAVTSTGISAMRNFLSLPAVTPCCAQVAQPDNRQANRKKINGLESLVVIIKAEGELPGIRVLQQLYAEAAHRERKESKANDRDDDAGQQGRPETAAYKGSE